MARTYPQILALLPLALGAVALGGVSDSPVTQLRSRETVFSPGNSPKRQDHTDIGFSLLQELPLRLEIRRGEELVRVVPPPQLRRTPGPGSSRYRWDGRDGANRVCEDGVYAIQVWCNVRKLWHYGQTRAEANRPGVLVRPHAIALGPRKTLYASGDDGVIHVFDAEGRFVRAMEIHVAGRRSHVRRPYAMAMHKDGRLILCDGRRILSADAQTGEARVVVELSTDQRTDWLDGLALDAKGGIYLACEKAGCVYVLSEAGRLVRTIGKAVSGEAGLTHPRGVAVDPQGHVYVTDNDGKKGRIAVFDRGGKFLRSIKTVYDGGSLLMYAPRELVALADGSLVVAEGAGGAHPPGGPLKLLAHLSAKGKVLAAWGSRGVGKGQFGFISRLATDGEDIVAADHYGNHRVVRMTASGKPACTCRAPDGAMLDPFAIVRMGADHVGVFDRALSRCNVFDREGTFVRCWPYWQILPPGASVVAVVGGSLTDRRVYLAMPTSVTVIDETGAVIRTIRLQLPHGRAVPVSGLLVDTDETMLMTCASAGTVPNDTFPLRGTLLVLDRQGVLRQSVAPPVEGGVFFGPVVFYDTKRRNRAAVQYSWRDDRRRMHMGLAILHIRPGGAPKPSHAGKDKDKDKDGEAKKTQKVLGIIRTVELADSRGNPLACYEAPLAAGYGEFFRGQSGVICFDEQGRYRWSLGGTRQGRFRVGAMLRDGNRLLLAHRDTGRLACWDLAAEPQRLAETTVEIDNTSPTARLAAVTNLVTVGEKAFEVLGTVRDENLKGYRIYYRALPQQDHKAGRWQAAQSKDATQPVTDGVLGTCQVPRGYRDRGIELKVIALDHAGNSTESAPVEVQFDDDGDGMSNAREVLAGTDPRKETLVRTAGDVQIQVDLGTLMLPYLRAGKSHPLGITACDVANPADPKKLYGAKVRLEVDAGQCTGGISPDGLVTLQNTRNLQLVCPQADSATVTVTVTFLKQALHNIQYPRAVATFELDVRRDDDEDWVPDAQETTAANDDGVRPLAGQADSDSDGVIDGYDLAPRASYNAAGDWSSLYAAGMIRYSGEFVFMGIGGGGSKVVKYGSTCSGKNILRSDRVLTSKAMTGYLDDVLFDRGNSDPKKRKPFGVVDWTAFAPTLPEKEDKLGVYHYGGSLHPEYYFHYYTLSSRGTPVFENVEEIDGTKYAEAGIHRNYLKVSFPGCDEYLDRTLTLQWKVTGTNFTGAGSWSRPMMRMAWLVEVFNDAGLLGSVRRFQSFALAEHVTGKVYQAHVDIPGEKISRGRALFVKLTPCWMERTRGVAVCPNCARRQGDAFDDCQVCGAGLGRYRFRAVDKSQLSVSGVEMATNSECVQWIGRQVQRDNKPMDADLFDQVCIQAAKKIRETPGHQWPLVDEVYGVNAHVGGNTYRVWVCSVRGMTCLPKELTAAEQETHLKQAAQQLTTQLPYSDVVCLIANTQRQMTALTEAVAWGEPGTWYEWGPALDGAGSADDTASGGDAAAGPTDSGSGQTDEPPDARAQRQQALTDACQTTKTRIMTTVKWYCLYRNVQKWAKYRGAYNLKAGDSAPFGRTLGLTTKDPVTGTMLQAQRSVSIQRRFQGGFVVSTRTVVRRPYTVWTDPKTGITLTDKGRSQELVLHRTERVMNPDNSKLLKRSKQFPGTVPSRWDAAMEHVKTGLKAGQVLVSNGLRFYRCYQEGDKVGMALYVAKGALEGVEVVAKAKNVDNVFLNGLVVSKTGGARVSLVGVAVGVLETGYYAYRWHEADNPLDRNQACESTVACAFDAGLGAFEPWGGVILASWTVGVHLGDWISDKLGWTGSPVSSAVVSSPGQALVFLPLHWLPLSVPSGIAKQAGRDAQEDAVDLCKARNRRIGGRLTYLFVPPK